MLEWVKLAQRIPMRIHIDEVPEGVLISSGMTCTVIVAAALRPWTIGGSPRERGGVVWKSTSPS
jgi:hypothetical protein